MATEIESGIQQTPRKSRGRRAASGEAKKPSAVVNLAAALKFVSHAQSDEGLPYQTHCMIVNNWIIAFDGCLTIGCPVETELRCCPNTETLTLALAKCGPQVTLNYDNNQTLEVASGKFKAKVPCLTGDGLPESYPDSMLGPIDEEFINALCKGLWLVDEDADRPIFRGAWVTENTIVSTNGHVLIEYWHGLNFPRAMIIPEPCLQAIKKAAKKIIGIGFCDSSVTFHFEDQSFIKSQLLKEEPPETSQIFEGNWQPFFVPDDFYIAIDHVKGFTDYAVKIVGNWCEAGKATYEMKAATCAFKIVADFEYLEGIKELFHNTRIHEDRKITFQLGNYRGCLMLMKND